MQANVQDRFVVKMYDAPKGVEGRKAVEIPHEFAGWDQSAIDALWRKGAQRLVNDFLSGADAADKPRLAAEIVAKLNAGETWHAATGTVPRTATAGPDRLTEIARQLARQVIKLGMDKVRYKSDWGTLTAAEAGGKLDAWLETDPRAEKVWEVAKKRLADEEELKGLVG